MHPYFTGLVFGLVFIVSLGPAFFSLVQTSVQKGFRPAMFLAFGISLSDVMYVILALLGVASMLENPATRMWMAIAGTIVLFAYGTYSWFKPPVIYKDDSDYSKEFSPLKYLAKGFFLNGLNPFIIVFWMSIIGFVAVNYDYSNVEQYYFFLGVLTTILSTDLGKAFLAQRLRNFITPHRIKILNRSIGVILILFGFQMIYFLMKNYVFA